MCQSSVGEPSRGAIAPHRVTSARQGRPSTPVTPVTVIGGDATDATRPYSGRMDAAVLIPVKRFSAAKRRLAGLLDAGARAELARWLAGRVVAAARPSPVFVACDDDGVATWADSVGAEVLWSPGLGLNGAVDAGRTTIAGKGYDHLVIVHSDIPLAHDLGTVARAGTVTLVPDRRRAGTNVLALPVAARVPASYGNGSFTRHLDLAMQGGYPVEVRVDPLLALDVDNPDDLAHPLLAHLLPQWLRTILASPR
jgi:2-phospho-L-lactate/phosphoenolpyruvate guanylyltransferase